MIHIDNAVSKDCINIHSYGEICICCGCCSRNPDYRGRVISRIRYYKERLEEVQDSSNQFDDAKITPRMREIRKQNILVYKQEIRKNKKILRTLERR